MARTPGHLVDRESEREQLVRLSSRPGPTLALLYGRRRVGKTYLLDRAWEGERVFYFLAADSVPDVNRTDLVRDLAAWSGRELDPDDFPTWRTVFRTLAGLARQGPVVVVLDEFQYLLGGEDDAASQLVAVWDREVEGLPLTLVLCGSEVSTMDQLQDADRPLYGRLDWSHRLEPFDYLDAARMLPGRSPREVATIYGIFGGTPQYLAAIGADEPLADAVKRTLLTPGGPVRVQVDSIIEQEKGIRNPAEYRAVLTAIARGRTRKNEIADAAGMTGRTGVLRHILGRLEGLGLIWREQNFEAPANAPYRYRISDNALRFGYRLVDANRSALETGAIDDVWERRIAPRLDTYMGPVFEGIAAEAYRRLHARWDLAAAARWARWEGRDRERRSVEVDIVARLTDGTVLTGEVKWSSSPVDASIHTGHLRKLEALAASGRAWAHDALAEDGRVLRAYVSAAGFSDAVHALADADNGILLLELADLYPD